MTTHNVAVAHTVVRWGGGGGAVVGKHTTNLPCGAFTDTPIELCL